MLFGKRKSRKNSGVKSTLGTAPGHFMPAVRLGAGEQSPLSTHCRESKVLRTQLEIIDYIKAGQLISKRFLIVESGRKKVIYALESLTTYYNEP
jgi:hypothetical protein